MLLTIYSRWQVRPKTPKHKRIKTGRIIDKPYMQWMCTNPCLACGVFGVQAHHPINSKVFESRGRFGKAHDTEAVALCYPHHGELHDIIGDEAKFETKYGLDFAEAVVEYRSEYLTGQKD